VIAVDTNVLVHAHRRDSQWHQAAQASVRELAEGAGRWALPWPCIHEFLAIVTHPRIWSPPTPVAAALAQVEAWLESPTIVLLHEGDDYWPRLKAIVSAGRVDGPRVHDARVAALGHEHGVRELWTADRDFSRFKDLRTRNPLLG
jgi:toxin-antitoxin system PIN domain toxin